MRGGFPFEWITAIRFLREDRHQTLFIVIGISIGVAVIVFMTSMLAGLEVNFIRRVLTSQPHIELTPPNEVARPLRNGPNEFENAMIQRPTQRVISINQWPKIVSQMKDMPGVMIVSPSILGSALAIRGDATRSVSLMGVEPESYFKIVKMQDYLKRGHLRLLSDDVLIGVELAQDMGVKVGDKINISMPRGGFRPLTVSGIFDLGSRGVNQRNIYVSLRTAQSLQDMIGGVTSIALTVEDIYEAEVLAQRIQATYPVEATSWIVANGQFFTAVQAQRTSNSVIRLFVALSVACGIAAVLIVSVVQRSKDIGIMRAMGVRKIQVMRIFLIEGGLLGLMGSVLGSFIGGASLMYWHSIARQVDGSELFPLVLTTQMFSMTILLAVLTGLLAAMAPAVRAANLDPVVAIRG